MLDQNLEGLPGLYKIADDILITGRGETLDEAMHDHDRNLLFLTFFIDFLNNGYDVIDR